MTDFEWLADNTNAALDIAEKGVVIQTWPEDNVFHMWADGKIYEVKMTFIKESEFPD